MILNGIIGACILPITISASPSSTNPGFTAHFPSSSCSRCARKLEGNPSEGNKNVFVVAHDGSGDFDDILEAINKVSTKKPRTIEIREGIYDLNRAGEYLSYHYEF